MAYVFGAEQPWSGRFGNRLGHHASTLLIVAVLAVIAVGLVPPSGVLMFTLPVALFAAVIVLFVSMRAHDRRLCEHCAAEIPMNPAEKAKRLSLRFWVAHTGSEPRYLIPYLAVLIGSNFATSTTLGLYCWAAIQATMIYLVLAYRTHRQLQPWCAWCSDGGGGEEVEDLPPVLPRDDRQLT